jgi:hypothetical protein
MESNDLVIRLRGFAYAKADAEGDVMDMSADRIEAQAALIKELVEALEGMFDRDFSDYEQKAWETLAKAKAVQP